MVIKDYYHDVTIKEHRFKLINTIKIPKGYTLVKDLGDKIIKDDLMWNDRQGQFEQIPDKEIGNLVFYYWLIIRKNIMDSGTQLPFCSVCGVQKECRYSKYNDSITPIIICLQCHRIKVIENRFTFHPVKERQADIYLQHRAKAKEFALLLIENCPDCVELVEAINRLDEVVYWANAAVARNT